MKRCLHEYWPLVAVVLLTVILTLQIPRKALFFVPVPAELPKPFASFVAYDAAAYERVVQQVRMSWQMRGANAPSFESRGDALDFEEDEPRLESLGLPPEFSARQVSGPVQSLPLPPLLPPSVADRSELVPVAAPPDDRVELKALRADLLSIPESLQSNE